MTSQTQDPNQPAPNIDFTSPYTMRRPAPILSISMNHPIGKLARKIKNFLVHKQTLFSTTFTIKITPIVSIVSLFGLVTLFGGGWTTAYHFGKTVEEKFLMELSPTPKLPKSGKGTDQKFLVTTQIVNVSKAGIIKMTYSYNAIMSHSNQPVIDPPLNPPLTTSGSALLHTLPTSSPTPIPSLFEPEPQSRWPTPIVAHYILTRGESIIFLLAPPAIHLHDYVGMKVLITGNFDVARNTLAIEKPEDIEILQ